MFHLSHIFLSQCSYYVVRGGALGIGQCGATQVAALWRSIWGRAPEGTMPLAQTLSGFQSLLPLPTSKLGPSGAKSWVGGFVYVLGG